MTLLPLITFDHIDLKAANECLEKWDHKMGPLHRGNQGAINGAGNGRPNDQRPDDGRGERMIE
jgi:hypothetical protein